MTTRVDYHRYMASREWALKREAVKKRAEGKCERCSLLPLQAVHHLSYEHLGNEPLTDLQGVCKPCHEYLSGKATVDPGDVTQWCGSMALTADEMVEHWGKDWKGRERAEWAEKYGSRWEWGFLVFVLRYQAISGINLEFDE